jgi:hypothetical protein
MGETVIGEFEARRVERMLRQLYTGRLRADETLTVSGERDGDWLCVTWRLADASGRLVYPVEARVDLKQQRLRQAEAIDLLYDLLGMLYGDCLRDDRTPFTGPEWEAVDFEGRQVYLRGQQINRAAEAAASALLTDDAVARSREILQASAEVSPLDDQAGLGGQSPGDDGANT